MKSQYKWPSSEVELAEEVVKWLKDLKFEVYQEVQTGPCCPIADIVAVQNNIYWIIETKIAYGLEVMEQAFYWKRMANYVSIATPRRKGSPLKDWILKQMGVGHLETEPGHIIERVKPSLARIKKEASIKQHLKEQQKSWSKAGNNEGSRWTPFAQTCENITDYVKKHPGCTLKEMIDNVETHYRSTSSAKNSLRQWLAAGYVKGVRSVNEKGKIVLYLDDILV